MCTIIVAYIIFQGRNTLPFHDLLLSYGYLGTLIFGALYAYGFGAAPATALLLILAQEQNIFIAAIIGGIGALLSDILIFRLVRTSFNHELHRLERTKIIKTTEKISKRIFGRFNDYILIGCACIFISSPLPTEIGTTMLATLKHISLKKFAGLAFVLHTIGILIIMIIGKTAMS